MSGVRMPVRIRAAVVGVAAGSRDASDVEWKAIARQTACFNARLALLVALQSHDF